MPQFSVVIPTYNRADCLRNTLESVLNQTFTDFEVLVMDDGSTDHTRQVVDAFGDARVRYFWAENSGGPATPRNRGIDAATGDWVCFLDADDVWYPTKLQVINCEMSLDPTVDAFCNNEYLVCNGSGRKRKLVYGPSVKNLYRAMLIEGNRCSTSAMSVRRSFLNKHNLRFNVATDYVIVEDYDLWLRLAEAGAKFSFLDLVLGEYVRGSDSISLNTHKAVHNMEVLLRDHVYRLQSFESDKQRLWRLVSVRLHSAQTKKLAVNGQFGSALKQALNIVLTSPDGIALHLLSKLKRRLRQ